MPTDHRQRFRLFNQLSSTEKSGALWLSADHQSWNKKTQGSSTRPQSARIFRSSHPSPQRWRWTTENVSLLRHALALRHKQAIKTQHSYLFSRVLLCEQSNPLSLSLSLSLFRAHFLHLQLTCNQTTGKTLGIGVWVGDQYRFSPFSINMTS